MPARVAAATLASMPCARPHQPPSRFGGSTRGSAWGARAWQFSWPSGRGAVQAVRGAGLGAPLLRGRGNGGRTE
eukprot:scaffold978_cov392-Prasinococcus_capsulatus_cf.AAC.4